MSVFPQEVHKLVTLPKLEELVMFGNPIHKKIIDDGDLAWPVAILKILPNLKVTHYLTQPSP